MKTKLTVTVDEELVPRAKKAARRRGVSLSSVIEASLRRLATEETDFVSRWRGKFKEAETDDPRMTYLKEKYLADPD
jgi:post-segregation antitoxin (ccd killing protein)